MPNARRADDELPHPRQSDRKILYLLIGYMWLFVHRPFEVWPILGTLPLERVYMLCVIAVWALAQRKSWIENPLNSAFGFFGAVVLVSAFLTPFSPGLDVATQNWLKVAVFYVLLTTSVRNEAELRAVVLGYCAAVALYAGHSYREFLCGRHSYRMGIVRMVGVDATFNDPNAFAATLVYTLPLLGAAWSLTRRRWQRMAVGGSAALFAWCVFLTGSRAGFVGLLAAGLLQLPRRGRLRVLLALLLLGTLAWNLSGEALQNRYLTLFDSSKGPETARQSAEGRKEGFFGGLAVFRRYPALGCGPGRFSETGVGFVQAHNLYGQVLGELGIAGVSAFVMLLAAFVRNNARARSLARLSPDVQLSPAYAINRAVMRSVALMLLLGLGGHNLYRYTWFWFGAFQALAVCALEKRARQPFRSVGRGKTGADARDPGSRRSIPSA